jgi:prepilin-type N-terminal cleavage/methylation domain-containing protein
MMKKRGFTLIELMVVIAILTLLAGLAAAGYANVRMRAETITTMNSAVEVNNGLLLQLNEVGGDISTLSVPPNGGEVTLDGEGTGFYLPRREGFTWSYSVQESTAISNYWLIILIITPPSGDGCIVVDSFCLNFYRRTSPPTFYTGPSNPYRVNSSEFNFNLQRELYPGVEIGGGSL